MCKVAAVAATSSLTRSIRVRPRATWRPAARRRGPP